MMTPFASTARGQCGWFGSMYAPSKTVDAIADEPDEAREDASAVASAVARNRRRGAAAASTTTTTSSVAFACFLLAGSALELAAATTTRAARGGRRDARSAVRGERESAEDARTCEGIARGGWSDDGRDSRGARDLFYPLARKRRNRGKN